MAKLDFATNGIIGYQVVKNRNDGIICDKSSLNFLKKVLRLPIKMVHD